MENLKTILKREESALRKFQKQERFYKCEIAGYKSVYTDRITVLGTTREYEIEGYFPGDTGGTSKLVCEFMNNSTRIDLQIPDKKMLKQYKQQCAELQKNIKPKNRRDAIYSKKYDIFLDVDRLICAIDFLGGKIEKISYGGSYHGKPYCVILEGLDAFALIVRCRFDEGAKYLDWDNLPEYDDSKERAAEEVTNARIAEINKQSAARLVEAIKALAADNDKLENFQNYLEHHFSVWMKNHANTPDRLALELELFAKAEARSAKYFD